MAEEDNCPEAVVTFLELRKGFHTRESITLGLNYKPSEADVFICGGAKTGTTIMQQICHGLRSRGDMSFEEIDLVVSNLEFALDFGYGDLYKKQQYEPRLFKTHFSYEQMPKGAGKHIVITRKPADVAMSHYYFYANWLFKQEEITLDEFVKWYWLPSTRTTAYFHKESSLDHMLSWYPHRSEKDVLWIHYEDIKEDRRECVRLIAEFLKVGVDDEKLQELITKQSSFEFMKQHSSQFDLHQFKLQSNELHGLSKTAGLENNEGRVRTGKVDGAKEIMLPSTIALIDKVWSEKVASVTGYRTYEELRNGINKELNRKFGSVKE